MSLSFWYPRSSVFAGFDDDFFTEPIMLGVPSLTTRINANDQLRRSSPRYEVTENDKHYRLAVDVPGVKPENMKIELENEGRVLHITGARKVKSDTSFEEYKFDKRFTLGRDLDTSKITAHLSDGVLVLTATKKEKLPPVKREIAITMGEAPSLTNNTEK